MLPASKKNSITRNTRPPVLPSIARTESKSSPSDSLIDISLLDVMGIEEWLSLLKGKTESNARELWQETCLLALQLKASREILSIGSNLFSNRAGGRVLDRLVDATRVILGAERVYLMEIDQAGKNLVVTHTHENLPKENREIPVTMGIEGEALRRVQIINVPNVAEDLNYVNILETENQQRTRCVIVAPILVDGVVVGVINATNKIIRGKPRGQQDENNDLTFSSDDMNLLGFIATNAGLALKQSHHHRSIPKTPGLLESDMKHVAAGLHHLVVDLYQTLLAERVSIFTYSANSHALVCMVSKDIEGMVIPADKGFAGMSFTQLKTINIADAKVDDRHNKEVDKTVGFITKSVLCAPIVLDGVAVGVVQAINKEGGGNFSATDEQKISDLCSKMSPILKDSEAIRPDSKGRSLSGDSSDKYGAADPFQLMRLVMGMQAAESIEELLAETEKVVARATPCDSVGVYALNDASLYRIRHHMASVAKHGKPALHKDHSAEMHFDYLKMAEVSPEVKRALQLRTLMEFNVPRGSPPGNVLPDFKAFEAMVFPIAAKAYSYEPGNCLLVIGNNKHDIPFSNATKDKLEVIAEYFTRTLAAMSERYVQDDAFRTIRANFNLLNNTLGVLKDFVVLLNSEGHLVACNKMLEDLVGRGPLKDGVASLSPHEAHHSAFDGMHYTEWLTPANSPELVRDISNALLTKKSRNLDDVRFISPVYKEGVKMNYQVSYVENPDLVDGRLAGLSPRSPRAMMQMVSNDENHSNFAVVVIVQIQGERISRQAGGFLATLEMPQLVHKTHSAHEVVNAASSIIDNVRSSFALEPDIHESLASIQKSLSNTSRLISLASTTQSAVNQALEAAECPLVSPLITLPANIHDWEFDVTQIKDDLLLCSVIGHFFMNMFDLKELEVDTSTLAKYIMEVGKNYHDRPFHNLQHSACVTHFSYMLINETKAKDNLKQHQVFGILLSAVVHDVDHPGNTNLFEINSSSELALIYNDQSVLENHHCSTAFRLMRKPNLQLLAKMPKAQANDIRKTIISCVMATDMAVHFELIDETKKRAQDGWNFEEVKDQALLGKILLHAADLSNPVRPFHMTRRWAERISNEFNDQVSREEALGMPVLGFMKTPDEKAFCKNETGFASFVVAPMWRAIALLYPALQFLVAQLDNNLLTWKSTLEELQAADKRAEQAAQESKK